MSKTTKTPANPRAKPGSNRTSTEQRHDHFVEAYIANGGNATQAAITAGYSAKTATVQASKLLTDINISEAIKKRQTVLSVKYKLDTESVLQQLASLVYADPRKAFGVDGCLLPVSEWPDEVAAMVASVEVDALYEGSGRDRKQIGVTQKVKFWDKNSAIDKAMKHLGQFEKDNKQKNPFQEMSKEQLQRFIARKQEEVARNGTVH